MEANRLSHKSNLDPLRVLLARLGFDHHAALGYLSTSPVHVALPGSVHLASHLEPLTEMFEEFGIPVERAANLVVLPVRSYLSPKHDEMIQRFLDQDRQVLLCKPFAAEPWVGPLLHRGGPPCAYCFTHWVGLHFPHIGYLQQVGLERPVIEPAGFSLSSLAGTFSVIVTQVAEHFLSESHSILTSTLLSIDIRTGTHRRHAVPPLPAYCASCRTRRPLFPVALDLELDRCLTTSDGVDRTAALEEAYRRAEPLISPITGIITDLKMLSLSHANL